MHRTCKKCSQEKDIEEFPLYNAKQGKRRYECNSCQRGRMNSYYEGSKPKRLKGARDRYHANPAAVWSPERKERAYKLARERKQKYLEQVLAMYGPVCVACGEDTPIFLTIDHIHNDGWEKRKENYREAGIAFYLDILRNGKRHDLEILCFNCNYGKNRNGGVLVKDRRVNGRCNDQSESS